MLLGETILRMFKTLLIIAMLYCVKLIVSYRVLSVYHTIDTKQQWKGNVTNHSCNKIHSRVFGVVTIRNKRGHLLDRHKMQIKSVSLKSNESRRLCLKKPIPIYTEPVYVTCILHFSQINHTVTNRITYYRGPHIAS